jgi:hypothetical protein
MRVIARRGRVTDDSFFLLCCLFGAGDVMVAEMVRHEGHVADRCQDAVLILRVAFIAGLRRRDEITDQQTRTARATSSVNKPLSENVERRFVIRQCWALLGTAFVSVPGSGLGA